MRCWLRRALSPKHHLIRLKQSRLDRNLLPRHGRESIVQKGYSYLQASLKLLFISDQDMRFDDQFFVDRNSLAMARQTHLVAPPPSEMQVLQRLLGLQNSRQLDARLQHAVFVCIDCEAYERDQSKITEIGVAVLDTENIGGLPPGDNAENWLSNMEYAHYRPIQHAKFLNRRYVKGREDFFNFGTTTWIDLADCGKVLSRVFMDPSRVHEAANFNVKIRDQGRNVIFVGHGLKNDKDYLKKVGFSLTEAKSLVRGMDTQSLGGGTQKSQLALRRLLLSLGLHPVNLHNGGNDAAYTLQALALMAFNEKQHPGSVSASLEAHAGKMPPEVRTNNKAPEVWAGTATKEDMDETAERAPGFRFPTAPAAKSTSTKTSGRNVVPPRVTTDRRQHKRDVRFARAAPASGDEGTKGFNETWYD